MAALAQAEQKLTRPAYWHSVPYLPHSEYLSTNPVDLRENRTSLTALAVALAWEALQALESHSYFLLLLCHLAYLALQVPAASSWAAQVPEHESNSPAAAELEQVAEWKRAGEATAYAAPVGA